MIKKLRYMSLLFVAILLTLSSVTYGEGSKDPAQPIGDALDTLTDKEVFDFFSKASNMSQLMYIVMVIMIIVVLFNLIVFVYLVTSQNKVTKRMSESQDSSIERFSKSLEKSSKMQADALESSARLHYEALNKNSETLTRFSHEMSNTLTLLSQTMAETHTALGAQCALIEKLIDRVLKDMSGDHKALFDRFSEMSSHCATNHNDMTRQLNEVLVKVNESLTWCKSRANTFRNEE